MGGGDTYMLRTAAARVGFGTGLGLLLGSPDAQIDARYVGLNEASGDPSAPAANGAVVYTKDNGAGKTQLCVRFATGAIQVIATQP
ncbi:MAG: LamG protein, partial [Actinomycetota bacterium]|nr:LamG protein [Actinomycetota bacterium]